MKFLIYTDPHFSTYSSIVRSRGKTFSTRLENLIDSITWVERLAIGTKCDSIICLGDFFDSPDLTAEEITALNALLKKVSSESPSYIPHAYLVGNHEIANGLLTYTSTKIFHNQSVFNTPQIFREKDIDICFLPYILETNRKPIAEYFGEKTSKPRIIFSHNDIKGIQMGGFISKDGFSIDDIHNNCDLFINGHLHNGEKITDKIINLGNITGQNFSEDATKYKHCAMFLDTDTLTYELVENPYALHFYKFDFTNERNDTIRMKLVDDLASNSVCAIKCKEAQRELISSFVKDNENILAHRFLIVNDAISTTMTKEEIVGVDHLQQFCEYIKNNIASDNIEIRDDELARVVKE